MHILFIPFTDREGNRNLIQMASRWQAAHATQDSTFAQVENRIYKPGLRVLEDVTRDDVLHILAHGQGNDYIVNDTVPMQVRDIFGQLQDVNPVLNAELLAARVHESGLPSRHRVIRLSICNTNGTFARFATDFKAEMWQRNYTGALEVWFYGASVSIPLPLEPGVVAQHVKFPGPVGTIVPMPQGLVPLGKLVPAEPFMYRA